ncbi:hypothetical protein [Meiothermus sp.]|uniref:hypothetical protein n=1 Tax=Meiothermus sp. TaxID=1955249 RepID=UPI0026268DD2|nr:hypothetical protein [Meiothermus sp.]
MHSPHQHPHAKAQEQQVACGQQHRMARSVQGQQQQAPQQKARRQPEATQGQALILAGEGARHRLHPRVHPAARAMT